VALTANLDAAGTSNADWNWAQLIIRAAATGGSTTTKTMTETVNLADSQFDYLRLVRQPSDSVLVSDQAIDILRFKRTAEDTLTVVDSIVKQLVGSGLIVTKIMSDTLLLTDGTIRIVNFVRAQSDTITVAEGGTYRQLIITASETLSLADETVEIMRFKRVADDAVALIDAFSKSVGSAGGITYAKVMSDSVTMIDNAGQRWTMRTSRLSDSLLISDAALRALARIRTHGETIELVDGVVRVTRSIRIAQDTIDIPDELIRAIFFDVLQPTNFRFGVGSDPFVFRMGALPFH
jgi:hypothetical protein